MRILIAALALSVSAVAAQAAEPLSVILPEGNVVEFDVLAVAAPPALPGVCAVSGITSKVWQGTAYRFGQPLLLSVPCAEYGLIPANARFDGISPVNVHSLQQSAHGIARLSDEGKLLWQDVGHRSYGAWGQVAGYRVLDARMLPVTPS
ncbi:MAG: hypothetical protein JO256_13260 [Alphaproteobacteria bacterium]|nr:hypothetical protein [Alphaproteobacteria bacterium]